GFQPVVLKFSDDRGATWSPIDLVTSSQAHGTAALPIVHPNGDLTILYSDIFQEKSFAQTSHDGGVTFDAPVPISSYGGVNPPDMRTGVGILNLSAALDPTADKIYLVWQDGRFRSDGFNDVVLSTSSDEGTTWTVAKRV